MSKNTVFVNGEISLGLRECDKGFFLVAISVFPSGKKFTTTLGWLASRPSNIEIPILKKGE